MLRVKCLLRAREGYTTPSRAYFILAMQARGGGSGTGPPRLDLGFSPYNSGSAAATSATSSSGSYSATGAGAGALSSNASTASGFGAARPYSDMSGLDDGHGQWLDAPRARGRRGRGRGRGRWQDDDLEHGGQFRHPGQQRGGGRRREAMGQQSDYFDDGYEEHRAYPRVVDDGFGSRRGGHKHSGGGARGDDDGAGGYSRGGRGRGRGGGHPPGLKGREIGLYYAKLHRGRGGGKRDADGGKKKKHVDQPMALDHKTVNEVLRSSSVTLKGEAMSTPRKRSSSPTRTQSSPPPAINLWDSSSDDEEATRYSPKVVADSDHTTASVATGPVIPWQETLLNDDDDEEEEAVVVPEVEVIDLTDFGSEEIVDDLGESMKEESFKIEIEEPDYDKEIQAMCGDESAKDGDTTGAASDGRQSPRSGYGQWGRSMDIRIGNEALDETLKQELLAKQTTQAYLNLRATRHKLPTHAAREKLLETIRNNQISVVSGDTGCGKTTQLCQYILDDAILNGKGSQCNVICTQPRRISAISVANRVAEERCDPVGGASVGYQIRLDSALPRERGSITYCTTGVVLRWLISDSTLQRCSHLVLDEIHERNINSDFLMIIIKQLLPRRPDLKLVLMSATLNQELFSQYFYNCPSVHVPGTAFPVQEYMLEDVVEMTNYWPSQEAATKAQGAHRQQRGKSSRERVQERHDFEEYLQTPMIRERYCQRTLNALYGCNIAEIDNDLLIHLVKHICSRMEPGAILIFLPGWQAIRNLNDALTEDRFFAKDKFRIIPLHSMLPTSEQREVFNRPPDGVRKVVLATSIAETSITIDDVVFVIDSGWMKETNYDESCYLASLDQVLVTKANATQRAGRAGRVQPGHCFHLYSAMQFYAMDHYQLPEMLRCSLDDVILQIRLLNLGKAEEFLAKAMQPPTADAIASSLSSLLRLSALDNDQKLTPLGYHLAQLPLEPHVGKLVVIGAIFSVVDPILTIAASLGYKDPFVSPLDKRDMVDRVKKSFSKPGESSDHMVFLRAFQGWQEAADKKSYCWKNFLSSNTMQMIHEMKGQIAGMLHRAGLLDSASPSSPAANLNSENARLVSAILVAGLYPRVAKVQTFPSRGKRPPKISTERHRKCSFHPASISSRTKEFPTQFVIYNKIMKSTQVFIYDATFVTPFPLLFFGGQIAFDKVSEDGRKLVTVDDWIQFQAPQKTARTVLDLRRQLDSILWQLYRESHQVSTSAARPPSPPDCFEYTGDSRRNALLQTIIDLISKEQASNPAATAEDAASSRGDAHASHAAYAGHPKKKRSSPVGYGDSYAGQYHRGDDQSEFSRKGKRSSGPAGGGHYQHPDAHHASSRGRPRKQHFNWRDFC
eukprot:scpid18108/ scgid5431/ Probable ATP-dependent RNA helicase DHX36; DEAH box protein 36; MLE-like protein 1; RNA helicase associated with AU-rich element ARE